MEDQFYKDLAEMFKQISVDEDNLEKAKQELNNKNKLDLYQIFMYLTKNNKISLEDLVNFYFPDNCNADQLTIQHLNEMIYFYDEDKDSMLSYSEFINILLSQKNFDLKREMHNKICSSIEQKRPLTEEIKKDVLKIFNLEISLNKNLNEAIRNIFSQPNFLQKLFKDISIDGLITAKSILQVLQNGFNHNREKYGLNDVKNIMKRLDVNNDCKITNDEFTELINLGLKEGNLEDKDIPSINERSNLFGNANESNSNNFSSSGQTEYLTRKILGNDSNLSNKYSQQYQFSPTKDKYKTKEDLEDMDYKNYLNASGRSNKSERINYKDSYHNSFLNRTDKSNKYTFDNSEDLKTKIKRNSKDIGNKENNSDDISLNISNSKTVSDNSQNSFNNMSQLNLARMNYKKNKMNTENISNTSDLINQNNQFNNENNSNVNQRNNPLYDSKQSTLKHKIEDLNKLTKDSENSFINKGKIGDSSELFLRQAPIRESKEKSNQKKTIGNNNENEDLFGESGMHHNFKLETEENTPLGQINNFLKIVMNMEYEIEEKKSDLAEKEDYIIENIFSVFESKSRKNMISRNNMKEGLIKFGLEPTDEEIFLIMKRFDLNLKGYISYTEFFDIVTPFQKDLRDLMEARNRTNLSTKKFEEETFNLIHNLFKCIIDFEKQLEAMRKNLDHLSDDDFQIFFSLIDKQKKGYFGPNDLQSYLLDNLNSTYGPDKIECDLIFIRLDRNRNGKIELWELMNELKAISK